VFTYISYTLNPEKNQDTAHYNIHSLSLGDTVFYSKGYIRLNRIIKNPVDNKFNIPVPANGALLAADITITDKDSLHYKASPMISIDNFDTTENSISNIDDTVYAQNLFVKFDGITKDNKFRIGIKERQRSKISKTTGIIAFVAIIAVLLYMFLLGG
jgi:cytochrome c-type biogenesis protein CcmF